MGDDVSHSPRVLVFDQQKSLNSMRNTLLLASSVGALLGAACSIIWTVVLKMPTSPLVLGTIQGGTMLPILMLASWLAFRPSRVPRALDGTTTDNLRERIGALIPTIRGGGMRHYLNQLARELTQRGHVGLVVLICPAERAAIGDPLTVPFEPTELRGCEERLSSDEPGDLLSRLQQSRKKQLRVSLFALGIVVAALVPIWAIMGGAALLKVLLQGLYVGVLVGLLTAAIIGFGFGGVQTRWLLVPGALVMLRARVWQRSWTPHLFRGTQSTIVITPTVGDECMVSVSDGQERGETMVKLDDVRFAIRALQSRIEPPRVEWLSNPS